VIKQHEQNKQTGGSWQLARPFYLFFFWCLLSQDTTIIAQCWVHFARALAKANGT
jgi:hypothetical protein